MAEPSLIERLRDYRGGDTDWRRLMDEAASTLEDRARLIGECREVVDDAKVAIEAATASFVFGEPTQGFLYATHDKLDALLTKLKASVDGATK